MLRIEWTFFAGIPKCIQLTVSLILQRVDFATLLSSWNQVVYSKSYIAGYKLMRLQPNNFSNYHILHDASQDYGSILTKPGFKMGIHVMLIFEG